MQLIYIVANSGSDWFSVRCFSYTRTISFLYELCFHFTSHLSLPLALARFLYNSSLFVACFDIFIASASVDDIAHFCFNALMNTVNGRGESEGKVTFKMATFLTCISQNWWQCKKRHDVTRHDKLWHVATRQWIRIRLRLMPRVLRALSQWHVSYLNFKRFAASHFRGYSRERERERGGGERELRVEHPFNKSVATGRAINIANLTESTVWHSTTEKSTATATSTATLTANRVHNTPCRTRCLSRGISCACRCATKQQQ